MIRPNKEFKPAFDLCMAHYGVTGQELEFEKQRVRDNMQDAQTCYFAMEKEIKSITQHDTPHYHPALKNKYKNNSTSLKI